MVNSQNGKFLRRANTEKVFYSEDELIGILEEKAKRSEAESNASEESITISKNRAEEIVTKIISIIKSIESKDLSQIQNNPAWFSKRLKGLFSNIKTADILKLLNK